MGMNRIILFFLAVISYVILYHTIYKNNSNDTAIIGHKNDNAPGRIFLLVAGIIYIVFGSFYLLASLTMMVMHQISYIQTNFYVFNIYALFTLLSAASSLTIGILGVIYRKRFHKAEFLFGLGLLSFVFGVISIFDSSTVTSLSVVSLSFPACFTLGAFLNFNASRREQTHEKTP